MYFCIIKYIFLFTHVLSIFLTFILVYKIPEILLLQSFVILSWKLNNNRCILTQLEDYIFNETIIDIYYKYTNKNKKHEKYIVPKYQRYTLYISFISGIIYSLLYRQYLFVI